MDSNSKWSSRKLWIAIGIAVIMTALFLMEYVSMWSESGIGIAERVSFRMQMIWDYVKNMSILGGGYGTINVAQKFSSTEKAVVMHKLSSEPVKPVASNVEEDKEGDAFTGVRIKRTYLKDVTLGDAEVLVNGEVVDTMKTLELPWKENKRNISCIPEGLYEAVKEDSARFKRKLLELKGVENRSEIKFHAANHTSELRGCIATGEAHTDFNSDGVIDITNSRAAEDRLMYALPDKCQVLIYA